MTMPDAEEAREVTGYERGAITPFGARMQLPVIIDRAAMDQPMVAIAGGAYGVNVPLSPRSLADHLGARVADISVPEDYPNSRRITNRRFVVRDTSTRPAAAQASGLPLC